MRLLLLSVLILPIVLGGALPGQEKCAWGPPYWCSRVSHARECGATQHCLQTVWKNQNIKPTSTATCTYCEVIVNGMKDAFNSKTAQADAADVLSRVCVLIPESDARDMCKELVTENVVVLIKMFENEINTDTICATLGLCSGLEDTWSPYGVMASNTSDCGDCTKFITDLQQSITSQESISKRRSHDEFDDCDLDLDSVVQPIGNYIKDREILLQQMFHCVRGQSLNRALPDVLKELPLEDLHKRCMEQLEVMSKKRILRILAGDDPASISSSGTEDETSEEEVLEMEEGEYESVDAPVVDSTSLCTHETCDSDREYDYEEGDVVHGSQSIYITDDEQTSQQQFEDDYEDPNVTDQDVQMEGDIVDNDLGNEQPNKQREPEEPEEGEVFDDFCYTQEVNIGTAEETERTDIEEGIDNSEKSNVDETSNSKSNEVHQAELCNIPADNTKAENENVSPEIVKDQEMVVDAQDDTEDLKTVVEEHGENVYNSKNNDKDNEVTDTEKTDGNNESTSTVDSDIRIVKTEPSINEQNVVDIYDSTDEKDGNEKTVVEVDDGHVLVVEADNVIDEEAANIGTKGTGKENSDEGEVSDEETKQKEAIKSSEVVASEVKKVKHPRRIVRPPSQDIAPALTRNQMELLELEMRARAIKAMLKMSK